MFDVTKKSSIQATSDMIFGPWTKSWHSKLASKHISSKMGISAKIATVSPRKAVFKSEALQGVPIENCQTEIGLALKWYMSDPML